MAVEKKENLFKKENRSTDGVHMYKRLEPEQLRICWLKNQRQIFCPSSGITNHNDFDMALFTRITEVICQSECESIMKDMRNLRNEECHRSNKEFPILTLIIFGSAQQTC